MIALILIELFYNFFALNSARHKALTMRSWTIIAAAFVLCSLKESEGLTTLNHEKSQKISSRRHFLGFIGGSMIIAPSSVHAEIDYAKIQDLLGETSAGQLQYTPDANRRPTYLTEPTAEFSANEKKATEFKRQAIQRKKEFQAILDQLDTAPNDEATLTKIMDNLRYSVEKQKGLPEGITKDLLVKQIRLRKNRKPRYWPTEVEIAYQDLIQAILFEQSPNTDRDMDNPF